MNRPASRLQLHIERLTVTGLSKADGRAIAAALESRLSALVSAGPLPEKIGGLNLDRLNIGTVPANATAHEIGHRLAQRIYRTLCETHHG